MKPPWKRTPDAPELGRGGKMQRVIGTGLSGYLSYFGPATLAAVAYIDPGNFGTDITAGAGFGYLLLWSVLLANLMGILLQYLSGKLGIATSQSLAELIRQSLGRRSRVIPYWLASEVFAVFTDLAEFLGVTSAIYLLSEGTIPLLVAAWISAFDVIVVFAFAGKKFRRIELMITMLVFGIGLGYVYEIFLVGANAVSVGTGLIIPTITSSNQLFLVVGIIGATVMPHALVLHSSLTKARAVGLDLEQRKKLLRYHRWDSIGNLTIAGLINMAILIMAAAAFHTAGLTVATVDEAYKTLTPLFGLFASVVFALTLLFSGLSSSTVGVLAGQSILEGFLGTKLNPWFRRIILRVINVIPTSVAISLHYDPLLLLVYSQVVLSLMIPLPLIPIIYYTSRKKVMGQFVNRGMITVLAVLTAAVIVGLNGVLLYTTLLA
ncbi:MAG: Mn(2+) uptake NRAMP transporter MntH [Thaumarchaeota archaeon]|nr:MAG: Mn(2+) uptake NRAMP transporter MntH [Nitrososphaerota archaeon]